MTVTVVIDGAIELDVFWEHGADALRERIRAAMDGSQREVLTLADGTTVLVNWPAVKTVAVREAG